MSTSAVPLAELPTTPAARRAIEICRRYSTPALLDHSIRSYLWAAQYAREHSFGFDQELLFVAAMMHDLGLSDMFDAHITAFEVVGAEIGRIFGLAAGWTPDRAARVSEVCVLHMRDDVPPDLDIESHLLQVGTSADVSGVGAMNFADDFRNVLFATYPRTGFPEEFIAAFRAEAARKPQCAVAHLLSTGWLNRMSSNPLPG